MKINVDTKPVEAGGLVEQGEFRIKNSAKAFSILSSGLYSNKHQAILRELGCNAYDSHVEAGKGDVPFTVHLPSKLNPTLSIRDYGIGLDHSGVVDIYTTYFESTKQDSNDYVGCMGLGSKSPFSYTDNFSITAIKDGMKRLYSAYINDQGIPSIALLHEEETDEGNGVEVSFAVNDQNDMYLFKNEASNVYKWFKTKPEITGQDVEIPEVEYSEKDIVPGVHVLNHKQNYYSHGHQSYALMGNVAYPIKLKEQDEDDVEGKLHNEIQKLIESGALVIEFNIGDLDISASREELSYIPHTLNSIYRRGEEIIEKLGSYIERELSAEKSKWGRTETLFRLHESNRQLFGSAIRSYVKANPKKFFKHTDVDMWDIRVYFDLDDFKKISEDLKVSFYNLISSYGYNNGRIPVAKIQPVERRSAGKGNDDLIMQRFHKDATVVIQDDRGGLLPRIKKEYEDKKITSNVIACRVTKKDADKDAIFKKVRRLLGNPKVVLSSTLPKASPANSKTKGKITGHRFVRKSNSSWGRSYEDGYKFEYVLDVNDMEYGYQKKYVYVPLINRSIEIGNFNLNPGEFHTFYHTHKLHEFLGVNITNVYGINKTTRKLLKGDKNWINLFDLFMEKFKDIDWKDARKEVLRRYINKAINGSEYDFGKLSPQKCNDLKNDRTPFGKTITFYEDNRKVCGKNSIDYELILEAMRKIGSKEPAEVKKLDKLQDSIRIKDTDTDSDIIFLLKEVEKIYPMLKHLELGCNDWKAKENWNDAYDYIKLVDSTL